MRLMKPMRASSRNSSKLPIHRRLLLIIIIITIVFLFFFYFFFYDFLRCSSFQGRCICQYTEDYNDDEVPEKGIGDDGTEALNAVGHTDVLPDSAGGFPTDEVVGSLNNQDQQVTESAPVENADVRAVVQAVGAVVAVFDGNVVVDPQASQQSFAGDNQVPVGPASQQVVEDAAVDGLSSPQV